MDDSEQIVQEILRNREQGAARLVAAYKPRLYAVAYGLCFNAADAEDLVFRTFERVLDQIETCRNRAAFYEWMHAILLNLWRNSVRGKTARNTDPVGGESEIEAVAGAAGESDEPAIGKELDDEFVRRVVESLSPELREVLLLRYFMDLPVGQIAKFLSLPVGTVKSRLHYARKALWVKFNEKSGVVRKALSVFVLAGFAAFASWVGTQWVETGDARAGETGIGFETERENEEADMVLDKMTKVCAAALCSTIPIAGTQAVEPETAVNVPRTVSGRSEKVFYRNDFSCRLSEKPIPSGDWVRYDYTPGNFLAYNYSDTQYVYAPDLPWKKPSKMQDGWISGGEGVWMPSFSVTNNLSHELPGDTVTPFGAFRLNTSQSFSGVAYHPIGNSFTNGTLKCWVDLRAPRRWGAQEGTTSMIRFFPAFRRYLRNPDFTSNPVVSYPAICGLQAESSEKKTSSVRFLGYSDQKTGTGTLKGFFGDAGSIEEECWYRFYMAMDLDTKKVEGSVRKLGRTVPDWDEPGTDIRGFSGGYLYRHPTEETGPIEGIGFRIRGVTDRGVVTNMACVTNIRIAWAPPGETEAVPCYSNNFITCWRRRLTPGTTSFAAPAGVPHIVTNVFNAYTVIPNDVYPIGTESGRLFPNSGRDKTKVEAIGVDGWRRLNASGIGHVSIVASNDSAGPVMRFSRDSIDGRFVLAAQTLGETISSGKVRFSVDARPPASWDWTTSRGLYASLGNATLYGGATTSPTDLISQSQCARVGLTSDTNTSKPYPVYYENGAMQDVKTTNVAFRTWCRLVLTADLDRKTYDWAVYDLGTGSSGNPITFPTPEKPVASGTDRAFFRQLEDISSFVLMGYGPHDADYGGAILFDNIQVWKNWDGTSGDLIYRNDFSARWRTVVTEERPLTDVNNLAAPETDFWVRRGGGVGAADVTGGENPGAVFRDAAPVMAVQMLGTEIDSHHGRRYELRADIRPPAKWYAADAHVSVLWGGESFAQGDAFGGADILSRAAVRVGFAASGTGKNPCGRYSASRIIVTNGGALDSPAVTVDPSHWYRFIVTINPLSDTYLVSVYRQGTVQPTFADANGTCVGVYEGLSFGMGSSRIIRAVAVASAGLGAASPWLADDPDLAQIDNLAAAVIPSGLLFLLK